MNKYLFQFIYKEQLDKMEVRAESYEEALQKAKDWAEERPFDIKIIEE